MKVLIFVCGEGLGHTGRCISLARELSGAGHDVSIGAYGYSKELIKKSGYNVIDIPQELILKGQDGTLNLKNSFMSTMKTVFHARSRAVFDIVKEKSPDFVISDGYYTGILAARWNKVSCSMIVNQSRMQDFFRNKGIMMGIAGFSVRKFYTWVYKKVDMIFVPDFKAPGTICGLNLDFPEKLVEKVEFSGPVLRKKFSEVTRVKNIRQPHILCSIGGFAYRLEIFRTIIRTAEMNKHINYTFVGGPDIDYDMLGNIPENVTVRRLIADPFPYYRSSALVICTGGHGTLMEALSFGLPVISFPDQDHNEQQNNSSLLEKKGYGLNLSYSVSPGELMDAINSIMDNQDYYSKTRELREEARLTDGSFYIRERIERYMEGVRLPASESAQQLQKIE